MDDRKRVVGAAIALAVSLLIGTSAGSALPAVVLSDEFPVFQASPQSQSQSSSQKRSITHHSRVAEEEGPPPELKRAEELIQKKNFADAEPLLQKVSRERPGELCRHGSNLGFVQNALGKNRFDRILPENQFLPSRTSSSRT